MHLPEKEQPHSAGHKDHYARIKDRKVPDFALQPVPQEEMAHDERHGHRHNDADHPGREKTAEHVNRGRSVTVGAQEAECQHGYGFLRLLHFVSSCGADDVAGG